MKVLDDSDGGAGSSSSADHVDLAMLEIVSWMEGEAFAVCIERAQRYRDWLNAFEAKQVAARHRAGHSRRATEASIRKSGKVSKNEAKKRTRRAKAVDVNKKLAADLENGDLSTEHLDAVADASERTDGAAATDDELIDSIRNADADQARRLANDFVDKHNTKDAQSEHDRQRRLRNVSRTITNRGTGLIKLEGDRPTINAIWAQLRADADRLYRLDGDRDVPADQHPRTGVQRLFDAAADRLTTSTRPGSGSGSKASTGRSGLVAALSVTDLSRDLGIDPKALTAELIGTGRIPASVLEYLGCVSPLAGMIFGQDGEILWHGRNLRHASPAQIVALTVRDKGCVLCGADPGLCEAHHLIPWTAPLRGETNIDNLALVCRDCHHHIHDTNQTLYHHHTEPDRRTQVWKLRTATPNETPPPQPERSPRRRSRPRAASVA